MISIMNWWTTSASVIAVAGMVANQLGYTDVGDMLNNIALIAMGAAARDGGKSSRQLGL